MVKTFGFLYQAWTDQVFLAKIYEYLYSNKSGVLSTDILRLYFDGITKEVYVCASDQAGTFESKITPVCISYEGMKKMINKRFDDLQPGDILYMLVD